MVRALLALLAALRSSWFIELVGAALIVAAVYLAWGIPAALAAAGVALVLKAFEIESRST